MPSARYQRIALDCASRSPASSSSTGVSRSGLIIAYSSVSVSPAKMSIGTRSYSTPSSPSSRRTLKQFPEAA